MHAPDGFLNAGTAIATGALSIGVLTMASRQASARLKDAQIPLAGVAAAFIFAGQMFNFPVAAGTTGHLIGAALAAILLGPSLGVLVVALVVGVQALVFADGGLMALGYNVMNMAIVPAYGGYALFRLLRRVFPASAGGVTAASGLAAGGSVVLASMAFSVEWLFGATVPVPFDTVFGAMVGVHTLIGVGEGVITGLAVAAVLASRGDLVAGASDLSRAQLGDRTPVRARAFVLGGFAVAMLLAAVVSQFAGSNPDGLERVAADSGFDVSATDHALSNGPFADYATTGIGNEAISLALAGAAGVMLVVLVGYGMLRTLGEVAGRSRRMA